MFQTRLLVGVVALIAAIPAGQASEKIQLGLAGEYIQYFGYADNNSSTAEDFTGLDVKADSEIVFTGETTLDNGIRFGVEVVLSAEAAGADQIDGTYLWNEGNYGRFEIGQADNSAVVMHFVAPDVGFGVNDEDIGDWVINPSGGDTDSGFQSTFLYLGEDQATKISWYSPRIAGFQVGGSYIPEFERDDNTQPNGDTAYRNGFSVGANFVKEFREGLELSVSGGFLSADRPKSVTGGAGAEGYSVGFNLSIDAFTIGGSYASTDGTPSGGTLVASSLDGSGFDIGVSYAFETAAISLSYYNGEVEDAVATPGQSTNESIMGSVKYELGSGVTAIASLLHSRYRADAGAKNEGTALIGGMVLEF